MSGRDINGYPRWVNGVNGDGLLLGSPNSKCGSPLRTGFSQCGDPPQPMKHWELLQVVVPFVVQRWGHLLIWWVKFRMFTQKISKHIQPKYQKTSKSICGLPQICVYINIHMCMYIYIYTIYLNILIIYLFSYIYWNIHPIPFSKSPSTTGVALHRSSNFRRGSEREKHGGNMGV